MPKLTIDGKQVGSSDIASLVLQKDSFHTRDEIYERHFNARHKVSTMRDHKLKKLWAIQRGNELELPTFKLFWNNLLMEIESTYGELPDLDDLSWFQPDFAYVPEYYNKNHKVLGMGSSIDFIIKSSKEYEVQVRGQPIKIFPGKNIIEIKTDFYKGGKLKPEWSLQVQLQMICAGLKHGIVVCFASDGDLHIYPMEINEKICKVIMDKCKEFWKMIEDGKKYPPISESQDTSLRTKTLDETILKKTNQDMVQMSEDYLVASVEERKWKKTKDGIKQDIVELLDNLEIDVLTIPDQYQIKSVTTEVPKKKMVETGQMTERHSFTIKEIKDE